MLYLANSVKVGNGFSYIFSELFWYINQIVKRSKKYSDTDQFNLIDTDPYLTSRSIVQDIGKVALDCMGVNLL